jgi:predicted phosphodiesterase
MRLAVISDIHGNLLALETVLRDIDLRAADAIVNLGDCVTSPLWPRETLELLDTRGMPTVRGNHDRLIHVAPPEKVTASVEFSRASLTDAQRRALGSLPATLELADGVLAVHGTPKDDSEYLLEDKLDGRLARSPRAALDERLDGVTARLILCGHSHNQHSAMATGDRLVVNPGSVGCPRATDNDDPDQVEASSPHARYAIVTQRNGRWSAELVVLAYDWEAVAERARENGRDDWARAFLG